MLRPLTFALMSALMSALMLAAIAWPLACAPATVAAPEGAVEPLPEARGGQDLIGQPWPELDLQHLELPRTVRASLVRWWTDTCSFCAASLPALDDLRRRWEPKGLGVLGVYHPKPPRAIDAAAVRQKAAALGFDGPLAVDADWSALERLWLSTGDRGATSAAFLVDDQGIIRFVHPGPVLFPSEDPEYRQQDADFRALEAAVEALLGDVNG